MIFHISFSREDEFIKENDWLYGFIVLFLLAGSKDAAILYKIALLRDNHADCKDYHLFQNGYDKA